MCLKAKPVPLAVDRGHGSQVPGRAPQSITPRPLGGCLGASGEQPPGRGVVMRPGQLPLSVCSHHEVAQKSNSCLPGPRGPGGASQPRLAVAGSRAPPLSLWVGLPEEEGLGAGTGWLCDPACHRPSLGPFPHLSLKALFLDHVKRQVAPEKEL